MSSTFGMSSGAPSPKVWNYAPRALSVQAGSMSGKTRLVSRLNCRLGVRIISSDSHCHELVATSQAYDVVDQDELIGLACDTLGISRSDYWGTAENGWQPKNGDCVFAVDAVVADLLSKPHIDLKVRFGCMKHGNASTRLCRFSEPYLVLGARHHSCVPVIGQFHPMARRLDHAERCHCVETFGAKVVERPTFVHEVLYSTLFSSADLHAADIIHCNLRATDEHPFIDEYDLGRMLAVYYSHFYRLRLSEDVHTALGHLPVRGVFRLEEVEI